MSLAKRRLSPEASRSAALEAARELLVEAGPQAVTLKAVAARMGRTHANLLHHFGSAAGLQKALAEAMAERITRRIGEAVMKVRAGQGSRRDVVDLTLDAFV
jgi:AcrR family transcriptional regulator